MAKIIIMKGLPASGKSTRAAEILKAEGNVVRINKDLLRTMLHFDKFTYKNEDKTRQAARVLAATFLNNNINVIIDDTNLAEGTLQSWKDLAKDCQAKIQYEDMTSVPLHECLVRDAERAKPVGQDVIMNMALRTGLYELPGPVIICDLDGTLCNIDHRLHHVKGGNKDWKSFNAGIPLDGVNLDIAIGLKKSREELKAQIVFVSGRSETYKKETIEWLAKNGITFYSTIIMRGASDHRPDDEVKEDILHTHFKDLSKIACVVDDRPRVIRMWKKNGLEVIDVGNGIEF